MIKFDSRPINGFVSIAWIILLVTLIAGPWLAPGYFFGTDFSGPRHYTQPNGPASYAGLQLALSLLTLMLPAEVVGKIFVVSVLITSGLTAYWTVPIGSFVPRATASLIYLFNPFVYDRLAYGQLTVLAGYALLPLVALATRWVLIKPSLMATAAAGGLLALVGILDVHLAMIAGVCMVLLTLVYLVIDRPKLAQGARMAAHVMLAGAFALVLSAYWLIPVLSGRGVQARTLSRIGPGDLTAFSTGSDTSWGLLTNVVGLHGFWAEQTGRFISIKEFVPFWPVALAALLLVALIGAVYGWRRPPDFPGARPWVAGLLLVASLSVILDIGVSDSHIAPLITWLDTAFPPYRGMRDANKWAAALALAYSQLGALGAVFVLRWASGASRSNSVRARGLPVLIALLVALPLYYGNGVLYGLHAQLLPSSYPAGWYAADHALLADPDPGRTVFLPWHGYLGLSFVRNTNQVVSNPAPMFFSVPVIASKDLEIPGIPPPLDDPDQMILSELIAAGPNGNWATVLAGANIKYVLVAREVSWQSYSYLVAQSGLVLMADYGSILLYKNTLWTGPH